MYRERGNLFGGTALPDEARSRTQEALRAIDRADVNDLLNRDVDVLVDEVLPAFDRATVLWDAVTMTEPQPAAQQVSDFAGRSVSVAAATITFKVPVNGDPLLLTYRSQHGAPLMPLDGRVTPAALELTWTGDLTAQADGLQLWLEQRRRQVETFLVNNNRDVEAFNQQMRREIAARIEQRRHAELARRALAARLPFPVERAAGAVRPLAMQRRQVRVARRAPAPTFAPEPVLEDQVFADVLADCAAQATVFERTPSVESLEEETLRNLILGMLNTNYTGQVAGELFNGAGKTDICIRVEDRNVFIGECKFYAGQKSVTAAVDQLLSYLVWRDTKAALLLFVRGGNFTQAVQRANEAVAVHPQCQRASTSPDPAERSDYVFARGDDPDRAIQLAVLPFHLRGSSG